MLPEWYVHDVSDRAQTCSIFQRYEGERWDVTLGRQWSCPELGGGFYSLENLSGMLPEWYGHGASERAQTRSISVE
jgi:hypothetical protein